jgi:3,2-trans-enoyl-CoA isomerase
LQIQGIQPPFWLCEAMINTIGFRNGEKACHFGELYSTEDALKLNLIDKLVDLKDIKTESENAMKDWLKIPCIYTQKYL